MLIDEFTGDVYKLRIFCPDAMQDWLSFLSLAAEAPAENSDPENLMSFEWKLHMYKQKERWKNKK